MLLYNLRIKQPYTVGIFYFGPLDLSVLHMEAEIHPVLL